jgi:hypothetical protein
LAQGLPAQLARAFKSLDGGEVIAAARAMAVEVEQGSWVEPVDSPYGKENAGDENSHFVPYGERVALSLARDAAATNAERAERWRHRCMLAERELGAASDATDMALDRMEVPADAAAILLEQLAEQIAQLSAPSSEVDGGGAGGASLARLGAVLECERAWRVAAEGALQAEQLSHAKTRQRLALAEGARSGTAAGSALVPHHRPDQGEPERRRQMATAGEAGARLRQRRALAALAHNRQHMLGVRAALLTWQHASAVRALRAWSHERLARKIKEHALSMAVYASLSKAVERWLRHVRGDGVRPARSRGEPPEQFESALLRLEEVE